MSRKSSGINAERELIHKLWAFGWGACRIAGSGSSHYPSPDIVAGNGKRRLAIECKKTSSTKYITKEQVTELLTFAAIFGAEPWIGIRFRTGWFFLKPESLKDTGKGLSMSEESAKEKGLSIESLICLNPEFESNSEPK